MKKILPFALIFMALSCPPCFSMNKTPGQIWNEGVKENAAIPRMYLIGFLTGFCEGGHETLNKLNLDGLGVGDKLYAWIDERCETLEDDKAMEDIIFLLDSAYQLPGFDRYTPAELLSDEYLWELRKLPRQEILPLLEKISAGLAPSA